MILPRSEAHPVTMVNGSIVYPRGCREAGKRFEKETGPSYIDTICERVSNIALIVTEKIVNGSCRAQDMTGDEREYGDGRRKLGDKQVEAVKCGAE